MKRTQQRRIVGVWRWNHSHKRGPAEGAQKVTGAGGPPGAKFNLATRKKRKRNKKPAKAAGRSRAPGGGRSGEHGVEMERRRGRADKAAMRATRLLLVPAPGRVTTSSSPTQQAAPGPASGSGSPVTKLLQYCRICRVTIVRVGFVGWFVHAWSCSRPD